MTEPAMAAGPGDREPRTYSKDYWDLVFEQLARRPLFKIGMTILALLYATAIYAPLIANDRPYVLEAIDYRAYKKAARMLGPVTSGVLRIAKQTEEEYLADRGERAPATYEGALDAELSPAVSRVATMLDHLPPEDAPELERFLGLLEDVKAAALAGDAATVASVGDEAKALAKTIRKEYAPREEGSESEEGKVLIGVVSYPMFEATSRWEAFFMALWALVLTWPIWNFLINRVLLRRDRERIRRWRKPKYFGTLAIALVTSMVWASLFGGESATFDTAPYKSALTKGGLVATRVIFPPLPIGYAETHLAEAYRPPTWTETSIMDEVTGHYVAGVRKPKADPITGFLPPATPVEIRHGEPGLNDWNRHIAGTDSLGRDFLVRIAWGGRVSLTVGILSSALLTVIGVIFGCLAGFFGGWVDIAIMRFIEILQSLPAMFLILMAMAFTDPNFIDPIFAIVIVIALIRWTGVARLVRGEFLRLREQEFVVAARALGFSSWRTIFRHVLPNAMSPVIVSAAFAVASGILTESVVSFLGFGVRPPQASWGSLVNESKSPDHWWIQVFPGLLIFLTVTCYNLVGDAVRDALDPKLKV